jgi:hypothetical protein
MRKPDRTLQQPSSRTMNLRRSSAIALLFGAVAIVTGCGGGGEAAGALTPFNVSPSTVTLSGPDAVTCGSGPAARVFVFGGAPPYSVFNTAPDVVSVSRTSLGGSGDFFDVAVTAPICLTTIPIVVTDRAGRQATFQVNSTRGT